MPKIEFSEYGHQINVIKCITACKHSFVVHIILKEMKRTTTCKHSFVVSIILKEMKRTTACKHIICPFAHTRPLECGQKIKTFFICQVVMLHIKLKGIKHRTKYKQTFELTHTLDLKVKYRNCELKYIFDL